QDLQQQLRVFDHEGELKRDSRPAPGDLNSGAKNTTKSPWWPQRDSNPCLVAVTFSPAESQGSPHHASRKADTTKTRRMDDSQIGDPQPPAGEQVAPVPLRNGDLRAAGCQSHRQPVTVRSSPDGGSPAYPISDLRTFVPIPYAALSQGPRHGTWPSGRQAF